MPKDILIIDDEELITKSLLKLLSNEGYNVTVVRNGRDALEKVKVKSFDLIISDIKMPDLDGIETIRQIRGELIKSGRKPIPEIVITGYADKDKYESAMDLKVSDYIYKPFERDNFLKIIEGVIG